MSSIRLTKRIFILTGYLVILATLMFGIGRAWVYFNSGADRAQMLKISENTGRFYNPVTSFKFQNSKGRIPSKAELKKLETDYINGNYVISSAMKLNDSSSIENYTTKDYRSRIIENINAQKTADISTELVGLNHNLELFYFSLDGKLAVLQDRDVFEYIRTFSGERIVSENRGKSDYKVILLLEDGRWRVKAKERTDFQFNTSHSNNAFSAELLTGINYYPLDNPWQMFGENFSEATLQEDFQLIKDNGLNSIRIFIPYHDFGKEYVSPEMIDQLISLMDIAHEKELKIIITLFDFYGDYSLNDWTNTNAHMHTVVNAIKTHPALLSYDLKNEPDLDFKSRGKENVLGWLKTMITMLKEIDPNHPVTIGWSNVELATELMEEVDLISFHFYEYNQDLDAALSTLKEMAKGKPIIMSEFGISSYSGFWNLWSGSENKQMEYHRDIQKVISEHNLSSLSWTLFDFKEVPKNVVGNRPWKKNPQKYFGFIDEKGRKKPAFKFISPN